MSDIVLVDGDVVVYTIANLSDSHAKKEAKENGTEYQPEPVSHVLHSMKMHIERITRDFADYRVILSSSDKGENFRYDRYPKYKAARPKEKPTHFQACREYLQTYWGAVVAKGEADDALAAAGWRDWQTAVEGARFYGEEAEPWRYLSVTIASVDKDLMMVPGQHYNWRKEELVQVTEIQGWWAFMHQLLTGDSVDTIPGLVKVGPKTANNVLDRVDPVYYGGLMHPDEAKVELLKQVVKEYARRKESLANLYRNADLLWMVVDGRYGNEVIKDVLDETEITALWKRTADDKEEKPTSARRKKG